MSEQLYTDIYNAAVILRKKEKAKKNGINHLVTQPHLANMDVLKEEQLARVKQLNNLKTNFDKTTDAFHKANLQRLETNRNQDQMQSIRWTDYLNFQACLGGYGQSIHPGVTFLKQKGVDFFSQTDRMQFKRFLNTVWKFFPQKQQMDIHFGEIAIGLLVFIESGSSTGNKSINHVIAKLNSKDTFLKAFATYETARKFFISLRKCRTGTDVYQFNVLGNPKVEFNASHVKALADLKKHVVDNAGTITDINLVTKLLGCGDVSVMFYLSIFNKLGFLQLPREYLPTFGFAGAMKCYYFLMKGTKHPTLKSFKMQVDSKTPEDKVEKEAEKLQSKFIKGYLDVNRDRLRICIRNIALQSPSWVTYLDIENSMCKYYIAMIKNKNDMMMMNVKDEEWSIKGGKKRDRNGSSSSRTKKQRITP